MKPYKTLKEIIEQLEMPGYQTSDGLHKLTDNAAFKQLKELERLRDLLQVLSIAPDIIEELKTMSNNYQVLNGQYVISKNILDFYIEYLGNRIL